MEFEERRVLHNQIRWDKTLIVPVKSDGFLTVIINGEDNDWTRLALTCKIGRDRNSLLLGGVAWSYDYNSKFQKCVSAHFPLRQGESCVIEELAAENIDKLRVTVIWMPVGPQMEEN